MSTGLDRLRKCSFWELFTLSRFMSGKTVLKTVEDNQKLRNLYASTEHVSQVRYKVDEPLFNRRDPPNL